METGIKFIIKNIFKITSIILFAIIVFITLRYIDTKEDIPISRQNYLFLGDSITYGYNVKEYFNEYPVVNSGVVGNTTTDILENLDSRVYEYNPTKIFLLIGVNDIKREVSKEKIIKNISQIIKEIKNKRNFAKIYVESIYPVFPDEIKKNYPTIKNKKITEINNELKKLCHSYNITYIDVYSNLLDKDNNLKSEYTKDGLHINDLGYYRITKKLEEYIKE